MAHVSEFNEPAALIAEYDKLVSEGGFFIVYLTGGIKDNGKSWCPDCDAHRATINDNVINKTQLPILKGIVEERNSWVGVSTHPWKQHAVIKAGGVPSIALHQGNQSLMRAEADDEFANLELLEQIACPE